MFACHRFARRWTANEHQRWADEHRDELLAAISDPTPRSLPMPTVTEAEMESRRRIALIQTELTNAIQRAHEQNGDIECLEVVAALLAQVDRWLKIAMRD